MVADSCSDPTILMLQQLFNHIITGVDDSFNANDMFNTDKFRIRIWTEDEAANENVIYDNGLGSDGTDEESLNAATTEIGGGSIVIHQPKGNK